MAPVPFIHPVKYPPLMLVIGYLVAIPYLTYVVGDSLYTSYKSLGPVSGTRSRMNQRRKHVPVFLGLAAASLLVAAYYSFKSATLSYKTWAYEHGLDLTPRLLGEDGKHIHHSQNSTETHIGNWLSDTVLYSDTFEIVVERARRFWWGQQIDLGTTAFSLLLATEGRRRKIPFLTAFLALAHLVNLSFAQNLFFAALLLTPSPLPSGTGHLELPIPPLPRSTWARLRGGLAVPKPNGWVPDSRLFYAAITLTFGLTLALPYTVETSDFTKVALLARASTFLPVLLPKTIPVQWGRVLQRPHGAYESLTKLFKFVSFAAFVLHAKTSVVALIANAPNSHYHRHSVFLPWDVEERSRWERSTTALGKVLGSLTDHPAVAAVGWDVLLCALSLGLWTAVRAINARDILVSCMPAYHGNPSTFKWTSSEKGELRDEILNFLEPEADAETEEKTLSNDREKENGMTLRRRGGNGAHTRSASITSEASDDAQAPTAKRGRGRPRKTKQVVVNESDGEDEQDSGSREPRSEADRAYVPTPAVANSTLEGDEVPSEGLDWESASLAWGLAAFGGLASASVGVFGGESVSR
ncbi:hypothetical protein F4808DRAFT_453139 [Astrocystis sublimbata]|nr:hypothetical protein F4808DRAFT_453139 [Astrocystis sublimbata]